MPQNPDVAESLTHLAIRYEGETWSSKFGHASSFPSLKSLTIVLDGRRQIHNENFVRSASAFGFENLRELTIMMSRTYELTEIYPPGLFPHRRDVPVDMTEDDAQLFSRCTKLERLSLRIGINVALVAALAEALPRDLKELIVESVDGPLRWQQGPDDDNWRASVRSPYEVDEEQMVEIVDSLPRDLRVLSLPIFHKSKVFTCFVMWLYSRSYRPALPAR